MTKMERCLQRQYEEKEEGHYREIPRTPKKPPQLHFGGAATNPRPHMPQFEPIMLRGMEGIGEELTPLTYTPDCPNAPARRRTTKSVKDITKLNIRKLNFE